MSTIPLFSMLAFMALANVGICNTGPQHGCGGVLNATSGVIRSPDTDQDGQYEHNLDCRWTVVVPPGKVIAFTFTSFDVEPGIRCQNDYVEIYDGISLSDPKFGRYCNYDTPPAIISSSSNVCYVRFKTDSSSLKKGFTLNFVQRDPLCGGAYIATKTGQTITSPGYPAPSGQQAKCLWAIATPDFDHQMFLILELVDLNLAQQSPCSTEYIEFKTTDEFLGVFEALVETVRTSRYCGSQIPPRFDFVGRRVDISYAVPSSSSSKGFKLTYSMANCSKSYTGSSGRITSPGYPNYLSYMTCTSTVTGPVGSVLGFYFNDLHIKYYRRCTRDVVEIYSGTSAVGSPVAKLCGFLIPEPVFVPSNTATLVFKTVEYGLSRGYDVAYKSHDDVDACVPDPCQNGATCIDEVVGYSCVCAGNYVGVNCTSAAIFKCSFETDLCQWTQDGGDDFDWTRRSGPTPSSWTGPTGDHTSGNGYYVYTEVTGQKPGHKARLVSPPVSVSPACLTFYYHMEGDYMGTLNVYARTGGSLGSAIFSRYDSQAVWWIRADVNITTSTPFEVVFEGIRDMSYKGDIAVDDVAVVAGACPP